MCCRRRFKRVNVAGHPRSRSVEVVLIDSRLQEPDAKQPDTIGEQVCCVQCSLVKHFVQRRLQAAKILADFSSRVDRRSDVDVLRLLRILHEPICLFAEEVQLCDCNCDHCSWLRSQAPGQRERLKAAFGGLLKTGDLSLRRLVAEELQRQEFDERLRRWRFERQQRQLANPSKRPWKRRSSFSAVQSRKNRDAQRKRSQDPEQKAAINARMRAANAR